MNFKMVIQYDGTRYDGWQKQGNTENTIQGKLEQVLTRMAERPVEIHGSGRTDAGVHALGQVATVWLPPEMSPDYVLRSLNEYLPEDILVLSVEPVPERFHARYSAKGKTYRYEIRTGGVPDLFRRKYQWLLQEQPDVCRMREAAARLVGNRDFKSFCGNNRFKKSTERNLTSIDIAQEGPMLWLTFQANGFLPHMVRILTGTLVDVGLGRLAPEDMDRILAARNRMAAGPTAPARGLYLVEVQY